MASRTEWQPAHDEEDVVHMSDGAGRVFKLVYGGKSDEAEYIVLTDKLCICKRVSVPAAPAVPADIAETIGFALETTLQNYRHGLIVEYPPKILDRVNAALLWLAAQEEAQDGE